jgi:hypothetical protein
MKLSLQVIKTRTPVIEKHQYKLMCCPAGKAPDVFFQNSI